MAVERKERLDACMASTAEQLKLLSRYGYFYNPPIKPKFVSTSPGSKKRSPEESVVILSDSDSEDDKPLSQRAPKRAKSDEAKKSAQPEETKENIEPNLSPHNDDLKEVPGESSKLPGTGVQSSHKQNHQENPVQMPPNRPPFFKKPAIKPRVPNLAKRPSTLEELKAANPQLAANLNEAVERQRKQANGFQTNPPTTQAPRPFSFNAGQAPWHKPQKNAQAQGNKPNWGAAQKLLRTGFFAPAKPSEKENGSVKPNTQKPNGASRAKSPAKEGVFKPQKPSSKLDEFVERLRRDSSAQPSSNSAAQNPPPRTNSNFANVAPSQPNPFKRTNPPEQNPVVTRPSDSEAFTKAKDNFQEVPDANLISKPVEREEPDNLDDADAFEKSSDENEPPLETEPRIRSEVEESEWERRAAEVQKQRLEAQKLKKRKRAEAEREERAMARLEEHRNLQVARLQADQDKEQMRASIRDQLKKMIVGKTTLHQILLALGLQVKGSGPANLKKAYKLALQKYHPDRHVNASLKEQLFAEELFKIVSQAGQKI